MTSTIPPHHAILLDLAGNADPATRRAILTHAVAVLTQAGHPVAVLGDQPSSEALDEPRLHTVLRALWIYRNRILTAIRNAHPTPGCLPVPQLRVPQDLDEFPALMAELNHVLERPCGHDASPWAAAFRNCPHAPMGTAVVIHCLLDRWRSLLFATSRQPEIYDPRQLPYLQDDLMGRYEQLDTLLVKATGLRQLDHAITGANLGDLKVGQVFSTDAGANWQACAGIPNQDFVPIFTGEHNTAGVPLVDGHAGTWTSRCLVRTGLA